MTKTVKHAWPDFTGWLEYMTQVSVALTQVFLRVFPHAWVGKSMKNEHFTTQVQVEFPTLLLSKTYFFHLPGNIFRLSVIKSIGSQHTKNHNGASYLPQRKIKGQLNHLSRYLSLSFLLLKSPLTQAAYNILNIP